LEQQQVQQQVEELPQGPPLAELLPLPVQQQVQQLELVLVQLPALQAQVPRQKRYR
jgi:hypothetical protein